MSKLAVFLLITVDPAIASAKKVLLRFLDERTASKSGRSKRSPEIENRTLWFICYKIHNLLISGDTIKTKINENTSTVGNSRWILHKLLFKCWSFTILMLNKWVCYCNLEFSLIVYYYCYVQCFFSFSLLNTLVFSESLQKQIDFYYAFRKSKT